MSESLYEAPLMSGESLNFIVRQHALLFHNQDWFRAEAFAQISHVGVFYTDGQPWPAAVYAQAFVRAYERGQPRLPFMAEYVGTSDVDHNGDRVYIGKAAEYGGLQIHRLIKPEIL